MFGAAINSVFWRRSSRDLRRLGVFFNESSGRNNILVILRYNENQFITSRRVFNRNTVRCFKKKRKGHKIGQGVGGLLKIVENQVKTRTISLRAYEHNFIIPHW